MCSLVDVLVPADGGGVDGGSCYLVTQGLPGLAALTGNQTSLEGGEAEQHGSPSLMVHRGNVLPAGGDN